MTERTLVCTAIVLVCVGLCAALSAARADNVTRVELSDEQAYPESLTASFDGTLYVGSPAAGGITRIPPAQRKANPGSSPGPLTHGRRSA